MLLELQSVDRVLTYTYENQLYNLFKYEEFDIRFLGDDYKGKSFTGDDLDIPIYYLDRSHGWSSTKFKKLIFNSLC
jgi:glycerol-3-phosphate cytidylyltransferase